MIDPATLWALFVALIHVLGVISAISALLSPRSSQSALGWALACITFPYLAVPAYWLLGSHRFRGYVLARRAGHPELREVLRGLRERLPPAPHPDGPGRESVAVFERLAGMPFTEGNRTELLINGDTAFKRIFQEIRTAREYILVQFFIVRADALSRHMRRLLAAKVREGVRVYFLYDDLGSHTLPRRYIRGMEESGLQVRAFKPVRGLSTRFQINFRNHRKLVLVDGRWAATGGANLGDEYRGRSQAFGYWRDTLIGVAGPVVQQMQLAFAEDWFYLTRELPEMNWTPHRASGGRDHALALATGPADGLPVCSMMFSQAINSARERLWLTSPYFVPDDETARALQLAALRGVDVRVLLPEEPDHRMVYLASLSYLGDMERAGVKVSLYTKGLLHEKVMLVDDRLALIGSANADNRSLYLNFEMTVLVADRGFAEKTAAMLEEDFANSRPAGGRELAERGLPFRLGSRLARLFSPVL